MHSFMQALAELPEDVRAFWLFMHSFMQALAELPEDFLLNNLGASLNFEYNCHRSTGTTIA